MVSVCSLEVGDLENLHRKYLLRTSKSKALFERGEAVIPGGVCHGLRYFPPYPFYVKSARGSRIWDVDGNEYIDYWMGHFALILGHGHPAILEALREQLKEGVHWGIVNEWEVELAEMVQGHVPCVDAVKFCNTGAEATMYAVRLARGNTGRSVILKAEGGWHGFCTDLLMAVHGPFEKPESLGMPASLERVVKTFPFNDVDGALDTIRREKDLAGVIVEPVLGAGGAVPADEEFLKALREETESRDVLLIFDEIITGFRLGLGGAQEYYGVVPDMVTLGKVLGGGMPVGAVAGREEAMSLANPRGKGREGLKVSIGGGTFSCNPMSMRAGTIVLRHLEEHEGGYERLGRLGKRVREGVQAAFRNHGVEVVCTGIESLFQVHFPLEEGVEIRSARDVYYRTDHRRRDEELKLRLVNEGVYTMHGGGCLSFAHTEEDVSRLFKAMGKVAEDIQEGR
ncbi:MAG: aspartate aminotransferase family protein [Thermoplasmata archaeon]